LAGIELNYTIHSTRAVFTSGATAAGLSADLILEAADWASVQTFKRFYHRESSAGTFARAVLVEYLFVIQFTGDFVLLRTLTFYLVSFEKIIYYVFVTFG